MSKSDKAYQKPTHDEIAACAHLIYEREGRPNGKAVEHWLQAEAQLNAERKAQAGLSATAASDKQPLLAQSPAKNRDGSWPVKTQPRQEQVHHN